MHKDLTEELSIEDYKMELENRIRNLLWTVSGDYTLDVKPDVSLFLRSKEIALYDGIKQGRPIARRGSSFPSSREGS